MQERKQKAGELAKAFVYLADRLTSACHSTFNCAEMYEVRTTYSPCRTLPHNFRHRSFALS
eukprot:2479715-Pleurochrysis_carterae.AAC.1